MRKPSVGHTVASKALWQRAERRLPGGVSSPVRAFGAVGGIPPMIASGNGAFVVDEDGERYCDYILGYGPHILGHAPRVVMDPVARVLERDAPERQQQMDATAGLVPWIVSNALPFCPFPPHTPDNGPRCHRQLARPYRPSPPRHRVSSSHNTVQRCSISDEVWQVERNPVSIWDGGHRIAAFLHAA